MSIAETSPSDEEQLNELFSPWNRTDAPGLTVGIAKDGLVAYRRGFGMASLEQAVANTPTTRMRIASTTKHFTALLALLLSEDGKIDLDAPIRTYIPELVGPGGDPSVRLLLQHRGGSRCYCDIGWLCRGFAVAPIGTALESQARQSGRSFAPGEAMIYNNGGYYLVSVALERVGGAPFESQLETRFFEPLGMRDTITVPSDYSIVPGMAATHVPVPGGGWRKGLFPTEELMGDGAIVSTIDDMLRWTAHLRSRDKFGSAELWAALVQPPTYADGTSGAYALGLFVGTYRGLPILHHAGGGVGCACQMLTFPRHGIDIVILANGAPDADPVKLAYQVADIVLAERLEAAAPTIAADTKRNLLGDWWSPETGMIYSLLDDNGVLKLGLCGHPSGLPLSQLHDGQMRSPADGGLAEIFVADQLDASGALPIRFGLQQANYIRVGKELGLSGVLWTRSVGRYYSNDADCTAMIDRRNGQYHVRLTDTLGHCDYLMTPLGETAAHLEPVRRQIRIDASLTLSSDGTAVHGFRLNTWRTRNLSFERVDQGT